jgi:hypothetical protein
MVKPFEGSTQKPREGFISLFSAGFFLILIGMIFVMTPSFFAKILSFFQDFDLIQVPNISARILLPAPRHPENHTTIYSAASWFSFAWGTFLVALLAVRILFNSPLRKKAENVSDIFFWLTSGFLIGNFLNEATTIVMWFTFWTVIIILLGMSLIIRAFILAVFHALH